MRKLLLAFVLSCGGLLPTTDDPPAVVPPTTADGGVTNASGGTGIVPAGWTAVRINRTDFATPYASTCGGEVRAAKPIEGPIQCPRCGCFSNGSCTTKLVCASSANNNCESDPVTHDMGGTVNNCVAFESTVPAKNACRLDISLSGQQCSLTVVGAETKPSVWGERVEVCPDSTPSPQCVRSSTPKDCPGGWPERHDTYPPELAADDRQCTPCSCTTGCVGGVLELHGDSVCGDAQATIFSQAAGVTCTPTTKVQTQFTTRLTNPPVAVCQTTQAQATGTVTRGPVDVVCCKI